MSGSGNTFFQFHIALSLASIAFAGCGSDKSSLDGPACASRISALETRLRATRDNPRFRDLAPAVAERDRVKDLEADPLILRVSRAGRGQFEGAWHDGSKLGDALLSAKRSSNGKRAVYIAVDKDVPLATLAKLVGLVDSNIELRLIVQVAGTAVDPIPADMPPTRRGQLERLFQQAAGGNYDELVPLTESAVKGCAPLADAMFTKDASGFVATLRDCGCSDLDMPTIDALAVWSRGGHLGDIGWVPLAYDEVRGSVQDLVAGNLPGATTTEPGLGAPCETAADCASAQRCLPFNAVGEAVPFGKKACTRACGDGCPEGFECGSRFDVSEISGGQISGVRSSWCAKIRPRVRAADLASIPRETGLRYFSGNLSWSGNAPTLFYGDDGGLAVGANGQFKRFDRAADAFEAFSLLVGFSGLGPRPARLDRLIPITPESVRDAPQELAPEHDAALRHIRPDDGFAQFSSAGLFPDSGPILYWIGSRGTLVDGDKRTFTSVAEALAAFKRAGRPAKRK